MSFHRLRKLAGLTESIADDPDVNAEIERRLDTLPSAVRSQALDALDFLKNAGPDGLRLADWASLIRQLHEMDKAGPLLKTVVTTFPNVVSRKAKAHYVWKVVRSSTDEVIDPELQRALGRQVELTSRAFALMRQHSPFSAAWLAKALSQDGTMPMPMARNYVEHLLTQFGSMLDVQQTATGPVYRLKTDKRPTRDDTMSLFRDLASKPDPSFG